MPIELKAALDDGFPVRRLNRQSDFVRMLDTRSTPEQNCGLQSSLHGLHGLSPQMHRSPFDETVLEESRADSRIAVTGLPG